MTINLHLPQQNETLRPTITVIGVGGAGGNAVNNMITARLEGVEFVVANTDAQALDSAQTERAIQLGANITKGLGAGADPSVGGAAAEEAMDEIIGHIQGSNMVFITAGMGGGTGTGAAPVIAKAAREMGILTVGVVTKPFQFEGAARMKSAESGLKELQSYVDTLIVIPNQNLFRLATEKTTFADAFRMADEVLHSGVRGVTDLMVKPGLVNLDFADIRTVMREMGKAMMGTGEATGEKRAIDAAEAAISNPLLDDVSLKGARAALINITGGSDMTLFEVDEAANRIRSEIDDDANIIFGSTFNDELEGMMRVSVVATGIDGEADSRTKPEASGKSASAPRPFSYMPNGKKSEKAEPKAATQKPAPKPEPVAVAPLHEDFAIDTTAEKEEVTSASLARGASFQPHFTANPVAHEEEHYEEEVEEVYEEEAVAEPEEEVGGLFSPRGSRPTPEKPAAQQMDAFDDDEEDVPSFGFLNRIAEVGKAIAHKAEERAEAVASAREAQESKQSAPKVEAKEKTEEAGMDEEYYDIPAFLRRQAN